MSETPGACVDLDLLHDGLALTITPDEPITGPLQVRVTGQALRTALAPLMASMFEDVRVAEAERIAEELHVHRHDHRLGHTGAPDSWFAGMHAAASMACSGAHPGMVHAEAHRAAAARAMLAEPRTDVATVRGDLRTLSTQVASLFDRSGSRPHGWNEAVSEVSLLVTEAVARLTGDRDC